MGLEVSLPDHQALNQWVVHRDAHAFRSIVQRYSRMVYATSLRILGNAADAEDVTQECFEALADAQEPGRLHAIGPWLHAVATRRSLNRIRSDSRRRRRETSYVIEETTSDGTEWDDIYAIVDEAVAELPDTLREPVILHFLAGENHSEIASRLGIPRRTVSNRIARGLERLRLTLNKRGVAASASALVALLGTKCAYSAPLPETLAHALGRLTLVHAAKPAAPVHATPITPMAIAAVSAVLLGVVWVVSFMTAPSDSAHLPERPSPQAIDREAPVAAPDLAPAPLLVSSPEPDAATAVAGVVITGRAFDASSGDGIAGARVSARPLSGQSSRAVSNATAADGAYRIDGLEPGVYELYFGEADGESGVHYGWPWFEQAVVIAESGELRTDFPVRRGHEIRGIVRNPRGEPVAGGRVLAITDEGRGQTVSTDRDGRFHLFKFAAYDAVHLYAEAEGRYSPLEGPITFPKSRVQSRDLVLTQGAGSAHGVVVNAAGNGIAGDDVRAVGPLPFRYVAQEMASDDDGRFMLSPLAPGDYVVSGTGYEESIRVSVPPDGRTEGIVLLHRDEAADGDGDRRPATAARRQKPERRSIRGEVTEAETGHPIVAFQVAWTQASGTSAPDWTSGNARWVYDPAGRFELTELPVKDLHVYVRAPRRGPAMGEAGADPEDAGHTLSFALASGARVTGIVTDADRRPLRGVPLFAFASPITGTASRHLPDALSAADGRFVIDTLPEGTVWIGADCTDFAPAAVSIHASRAQPHGITLRLTPGGTAEGRVRVAGLEDTAESEGAGLSAIVAVTYPGLPVLGRKTVLVRADGTYTVHGITPGVAELGVRCPWGQSGDPATYMHSESVVIEEGRTTACDIELRRGAGAIAGTVYVGRAAAPGWTVAVAWESNRGGESRIETVTDPWGAYRIDDIPAETVRLTASLGSQQAAIAETCPLRPGETVTRDVYAE